MTPADLAARARLLLGSESWQRALARVLQRPGAAEVGIDDRLVRRWASGERPIPAWVGEQIAELARQRRAELSEIAGG